MHGSRAGAVGPLLILVLLAQGMGPRAARGELVVFAEGGAVQLPVEVEGESVRLIAPDGPLEFQREDIRAIIPGHWPEHEWPARRDVAESGDALDRYRAAWWALEHGLTDEATAMLRSSHEADPTLQPVARLVAMLDRLGRPAPPPDLGPLRDVLPAGVSVAEGEHLVLLHQHDATEAAERLDLLDQVLTTFYLAFAAQGFELETPPEKLVAVWFAEESDYLAYLRKEAGDAFLSTRGYYHPTRRVVFCYDGRSRADHRRSEAAIRGRLDELERAEATLDDVPPRARFRLELAGERARTLDRAGASREIARLRRDTDREALLLELDRLRVDGGAAAHELVHQLVIASGLAPRYERFPVWLHEGLAMQFEEFRGGRWAGIGPVQSHRLDHWRRLDPVPELGPLIRDEGFGRGYAPDRYAASWALVYFLRKRHPDRFVAFLDQLRNPTDVDGDGRGDRVTSAFRTAFGPDLSAFRREWVGAIRAVRTPIDGASGPAAGGLDP